MPSPHPVCETQAIPVTLAPTATPGAGEAPTNLLGWSKLELERWFNAQGEKRFRAAQVMQWIHQLGRDGFAEMTNLSLGLRQRLSEECRVQAPEVVDEQRSVDGTLKWSLRLDTSNCIEMVFIPDGSRGTLCISSQAGCALNCSFCATAQQGFNRNLNPAEIIGQLWLARQMLGDYETKNSRSHPHTRRITNVVFMGMGEPLLNFEAVLNALELMHDDLAYGIARRRITLSTAGVVPKIYELKQRSNVSLAVSLHAPNNALRDELVPINRSFPIEELLEACRTYVADDPREKVTFEYVMIEGVNDHLSHARELAQILAKVPSKVNLIPFNPFPGSDFRRSKPEQIDRFREVLLARDIMTITRRTRGEDIDAACGQLAGQVAARSARVRRERASRAAKLAPN